jgi:hypothetical protein
MGSRKQLDLIMPAVLCAAVAFVIAKPARPASGPDKGTPPAARKFYADDPLLREPPPHPVKQVAKREVDDLYDFLANMYVTPKREGKEARLGPHPAGNINTLGEIPQDSWYTNRHYYRRMSIEELQRGPGNSTPPVPNGKWTIISAKSDGVTPGFVIQDERKNHYVLKFDPPQNPELSSGPDVIGSKIFYALGFNTPENYVVYFHREQFEIGDGVTYRDPSGKKRPLTGSVLEDLLKTQPKNREDMYRGLASRWIEGKLAGPFSYEGMRSDDPNDIVPHQDRRELRGLRIFAAWLNHQDTRSINSMDTLVTENGITYLKHYLLDFGSILGSAGNGPKLAWYGHEYVVERNSAVVQMVTLGLDPPRWARSEFRNYTGTGMLDYKSFDPASWKPSYPNPAFLMTDREDAFWAAKQIAAFTDEEIRALVETGRYTDPRAVDWITECLIKRRDKIAEVAFARTLPLDKFGVKDGELTFEDLAPGSHVANASHVYAVQWSKYDNQGHFTALTDAVGRKIPTIDGTEYLAATVQCTSNPSQSCPTPVTVYVRRSGTGTQVVGIDR